MLNYAEQIILNFCELFQPFHRGDHLYTSESAVYRRQILTYKNCFHTERIKIFLMVLDP